MNQGSLDDTENQWFSFKFKIVNGIFSSVIHIRCESFHMATKNDAKSVMFFNLLKTELQQK